MNLGAILGWKHNHEPGITTADGILMNWPATLGPRPTQVQIDQWTVEYVAAVADGTIAESEAVNRFDTPEFKDLKALALVVADLMLITPAEMKVKFIARRKQLN